MRCRPEPGMLVRLKRTGWWAVVRNDHDGWYASWIEPEGGTERTAVGHGGISDEGFSDSWHVFGEEECPEPSMKVLISPMLSDLERLRILHYLMRMNQR